MANTPIRRFAKIFLPALLGFVVGWLFFELIHKNASNNGIIYVNDMKIKIPNPCIIAYLNLEEPMFGRLFCERDEGIGLMNLSMDPRKLEGAKIKLRDKNFKSGYACGQILPDVNSCLKTEGVIVFSSKDSNLLKFFLDAQESD